VAGICIVLIIIISVILLIIGKRNYIDTLFASRVSLKYYYNDKQIDIIVTDENDIRIIKENLKGISYEDNPSCGFSRDISITFSDGDNELVVCPACDGCSKARIGVSNRYICIKDINALKTVLEKYGFCFPCI